MATPTPEARAQLDSFVQELTRLGDGLTLDDFRTSQIQKSESTALRMRVYIIFFSIIFMILAIFVLLAQTNLFLDTILAPKENADGRVFNSGYSLTFAALCMGAGPWWSWSCGQHISSYVEVDATRDSPHFR